MVHISALFIAIVGSSLVSGLSVPTVAVEARGESDSDAMINHYIIKHTHYGTYNRLNGGTVSSDDVDVHIGSSLLPPLGAFDGYSGDAHEKNTMASSILDNSEGAGTAVVATPAISSRKSKGSALDISFLGVFQLEGTILPDEMAISATLYVKIPFIGRVRLGEIKGILTGDGIKVNIDLPLAKGSVKFSARPDASGKHDLYLDKIDLKVKSLKRFSSEDIKLFEF